MIRTPHKALLGRIQAAYGIKGWVRVYSYTDPLEGILGYAPWTLRRDDAIRQVKVEALRKQGKGIVSLFAGVENRDAAEALVGSEIWGELPDLDEHEFYWYQLQGLIVLNILGDVLGQVGDLMETGANDVLVVEPTDNSVDDKSRLIPYVEDVVVKVSLDDRQILVNWLANY
ncbi:MAG: ribosome maturation factor RimM [Candidatus Azotimanducaceae bacterium]